MFRIGEFSKLTQVTVRMLRYYDKEGLLKPAEVDKNTGYRLYSADQIPLLNKIVFLRDSGFQLWEMKEALQGVSMEESLEKKFREVEEIIRREQKKLERIARAKEEMGQAKGDMHYNVVIKSVPSYLVLCLRRVIPNYYCEGQLWQELSKYVKEKRLSVSSETFSIYHDTEYKEQDVDVELCVQVEKAGTNGRDIKFRYTEPVENMASMMVYGPFSKIGGAYLSLARWLQEKGTYRMEGKSRQIVHRGPWNETDSEQYVTEIQIPLE